ncbi:hypothetical protein [uncultured Gimesia sp.]|uniref:hypothetical protein n=1 Tax=uncultured Gimesia sp. TaxID=1678688 RepID=UPI00261BAF61|nr:hypothetical protein [uncultured Gimesia sp.]
MIAKLLSLLLTTLILACPFNCMLENSEGTEAASPPCCSHCRSESPENPLVPQTPANDCCQCLCAGAIIEGSSQIDLAATTLVWAEMTLPDAQFQLLSLNSQHNKVLFEPDNSSGRELRCLQMSFQC